MSIFRMGFLAALLGSFLTVTLVQCTSSNSQPVSLKGSTLAGTRSATSRFLAAAIAATSATAAVSFSSATNARAASQETMTTPEFMNAWPYRAPKDILPYIFANAAEGDVTAVLQSMDTFATYYPQYKLTPQKADILSNAIKESNPRFVLELGYER